jgi:VWFA-related protein
MAGLAVGDRMTIRRSPRLREISLLLLLQGGMHLAARSQAIAPAVEPVRIHVTVLAAGNRPVTDLSRDEFEVRADGKPAIVTAFTRTSSPLSLAVMLDVSGSMTSVLDGLPDGITGLTARLRPDDRLRLGAFSETITMAPPASTIPDLVRLINTATPPHGRGTRLWAAIDAAMSAVAGDAHRRVVVVATDGQDSASQRVDENLLRSRPARERVVLYGVILRPTFPSTIGVVDSSPDPFFRRLVEQSGGRFVETHKRAFTNVFAEVMADLLSAYQLEFVPPTVIDKERTLQVRIKRPGVKVLAPQRYVAAAR